MITIEQQQYTTYRLKSEDALLEVVPERGGIITRWQVQGKEILYLDADRFANPAMSVRGGVPILFPICGNLPDNTYTYEGQPYHLKQHGFARDLPWQVTDQQEGEAIALTLTLTSTDETRAVYPFDFQLDFTYKLQRNMLMIQQRYTNQSAVTLPFSAGLHPYFQVSDKSQLQFDIPSTEFTNQIDQTSHSFAGSFDLSWDEIDVAFGEVFRQVAHVIDPLQHTRLTLSYDPVYSTLVFWTVKGKDYYCLEPWTAPRNALNTGEHLIYLEAGGSLETEVSLSVDLL
ncbi:aldose epimerase [Phormidium tenue FACHB-886]|nr:aldose epimerase [Phormidium tenue FACHB-886]